MVGAYANGNFHKLLMVVGALGVNGQHVQGHAEEEFDQKNATATVHGKQFNSIKFFIGMDLL